MTERLTDEELQSGTRVFFTLAPDACRNCNGTGVISRERPAHDPKNRCPQCQGTGHVSMLDSLGAAVKLARHPGEPDETFRRRIKTSLDKLATPQELEKAYGRRTKTAP